MSKEFYEICHDSFARLLDEKHLSQVEIAKHLGVSTKTVQRWFNRSSTKINRAMSQLDQAGQANAASAEEIAATSGEISHLAEATQGLTVDLTVLVLGSGENTQAPSKTSNRNTARKAPIKASPVKIAKTKPPAVQQIPFDEDDGRGHIGNASGF